MKRLHLFLIPLFVLLLLSACAPAKNGTTAGSLTSATTSVPAVPKKVETLEEIQAKATKGDPEAQFNLAMIYLQGSVNPKVAKDSKTGLMWLERSARAGFPQAEFNMGVIYYQGTDGVQKDLVKARAWFADAAKQKDKLALFNLGVMLYRGEGIAQDYMKAKEHFEAASAQGYAEGAYNIGVMYAKGEGVKRDTIEAIAWFTIADAQGHEKAGQVAADLKSRLQPDEKKQAEARAVILAKEIEAKAHAQ